MGELCTLVSCLVVACLMVGGGREGEAGGLWGGGGGGHGNCTKKIPQGFTFVVIRSGNLWYPCVLPLNIVFLCLKCTSFNVCACLLIFMSCCFLFRACLLFVWLLLFGSFGERGSRCGFTEMHLFCWWSQYAYKSSLLLICLILCVCVCEFIL